MKSLKSTAMILAAGLGTRVRPLTLDLPKPLLPIGSFSILEHIVRQLQAAGHARALLNTHYMAAEFANVIRRLSPFLSESYEAEILGTAGGVAKARSQLEPPLIVFNADIFCELDLAGLSAAVNGGGICLALAPCSGPGTVGLDRDGNVVRLRGERFGLEVSAADYVGVCSLASDALEALPLPGCLIGDFCLTRLRKGQPVRGLCCVENWSDIGDIGSYIKTCFSWLERHTNGEQGAFVGSDVKLAAGVRLQQSLVGAGGRISGSGLVERCIVWPGAHVTAPASHCIFTHTGRVVPFAAP